MQDEGFGYALDSTRIHYYKQGGYQLNDQYVVFIPNGLTEISVMEKNGYVHLDNRGQLTILRGYAWDGPSVPGFIKVNKDSMRASLVHDALYQLMRQGELDREIHRKHVDMIFKEHLLEDGMPAWRALLWYTAVRKFAYNSSTSIKIRKVERAP